MISLFNFSSIFLSYDSPLKPKFLIQNHLLIKHVIIEQSFQKEKKLKLNARNLVVARYPCNKVTK